MAAERQPLVPSCVLNSLRFVRASRRTIRFTAETDARIVAAAKVQGYSSPTAFIRVAVDKATREDVRSTAEADMVAASIDRLTTEVFRLVRGQQALFAFVDSLTKVLLTCIPEPSGEAVAPAVARGRLRYDRLIKAAGRSMSGDGKAAMEDLAAHGQD